MTILLRELHEIYAQIIIPRADPGYQANGGAVKIIFGVFHVKNHDFTQKKSYFFQF